MAEQFPLTFPISFAEEAVKQAKRVTINFLAGKSIKINPKQGQPVKINIVYS
jgi:hypothetical protein